MASQITIVFPGQGSQYVGMGKELSPQYFERASEKLGLDLKALCHRAPPEELNLTINAQPAILTHSITLWEKLRPLLEVQNISVIRVLGHSVGEYAALVCAGALSFEDAVLSTRLRGQFMQGVIPPHLGGMSAIIKLDGNLVADICQRVSNGSERVEVANFNTPDQVVISGHLKAIDRAVTALKEQVKQRFRTVPLPVSAPFHCGLMRAAAEKLQEHFCHVPFQPLQIPYVANIDGKEYPRGTAGEIVRDNLIGQVYSSVQWVRSTQALEENALVVEVGPGNVLKNLVKKCRPDVTCYSLDRDGLDFLDEWKGERA